MRNSVHLGNWREPEHSGWSFHHVREIVPSAEIAASPAPSVLARKPRDIGLIRFTAPDGKSRSVREFFGESSGDGMIVLARGRIVSEWYSGTFNAHVPHLLFSVSKSFTALVCAVLEHQGLLDPEKPVTHYVPEAIGSAYGTARVRHVLDMTVGIDFEEVYLSPGSPFARYREAMGWNPQSDPANPLDLHSFLMTLPLDGKPHGDAFHYVSPNSDLLGLIAQRASGKPFAEMMESLLWKPMGAEHAASITVDRLGAARTAGGISVTLRDLARVGEMMRCHGFANGTQVIPGRFVDELYSHGNRAAWLKGDLQMLAPEGHYRNQWYVSGPEGAMMAVGIHGQWLYADPRSGITIAKVSSQPLPVDDPMDQVTLAAFAAIAAQLA
jgi:CubicO group peptidase (beta-lactamase class C family)